MNDSEQKLRVLLIPDSIFWVTGTIAQSILDHVHGVEGSICSGKVASEIIKRESEWFSQFDLIHIICPYASRFLLPFFSGKKPVVTTIHHVIDWKKTEHNTAGDMIMTLSKEWENYILNKGISRDRLTLVRNGVDTERFLPATKEVKARVKRSLGFHVDSFVIGFFAKRQLSDFDRKGIDTFETALKLLIIKEPRIAVLLVGPGWNQLVQFLKEQGISFKWFAYLDPHEKIAELYKALDCYWITSRIEGGPVTLLEAMSCGVPCISTRVGLSLELIENGQTGFLIDIGADSELVEKTHLLLHDKSLADRLSKNARYRVVCEMNYITVLSPVKEMYIRAITNFQIRNISKIEAVRDSTPLKYWMKRNEYVQWLSILRSLGESQRAFRFGVHAFLKYPSFVILKLQMKIVYDMYLRQRRRLFKWLF